ncbi:MAG: 50S ribosomal protein L13 [Bacteroidota bacterium]
MNVNSYRTLSAKPADVQREWLVVDADQQVVGRLATQIAHVLRGKHRPNYTPHVDGGDFVVVVNAEKIRFTGNKETQKEYFRHTGYPGGVKLATPKVKREKDPTFILSNAVKGMLPKTKLGRQMISRLKVYAGPEHPHEAQDPKPFDVK